MIIKCIRAISDDTGEDLGDESPWLKIGKLYPVYAIRYLDWARTRLEALLENEDDGLPSFFDLIQFEIISNKIPSTWILDKDYEDSMVFMPQPWFRENFWEDLVDERSDTMELFEIEKQKILLEDPVLL